MIIAQFPCGGKWYQREGEELFEITRPALEACFLLRGALCIGVTGDTVRFTDGSFIGSSVIEDYDPMDWVCILGIYRHIVADCRDSNTMGDCHRVLEHISQVFDEHRPKRRLFERSVHCEAVAPMHCEAAKRKWSAAPL